MISSKMRTKNPIAFWNCEKISDAFSEDKEEVEIGLRISQGSPKKVPQNEWTKYFNARREDTNLLYTPTIYCHVFYHMCTECEFNQTRMTAGVQKNR